MEFTLQIEHVEGVTIADLGGEFDIYSAPRFKELMTAHLERGDRSFIVNLESITYLDSSGLAAVVMMFKRTQALGGSLSVVAPQPRTKRLLSISGIDRIISIFSTRKAALQAVSAQSAPAPRAADRENAPA